MNRPKKQHYIPQLLLRNFQIPGKESLWVFDKRNGNAYESAVRDVASERYFNDAQISEDTWVSYENRLERVENEAAPALAKLIANEELGSITPEEQAAITVFIATQMVRGKRWRTSLAQTFEVLCDKLGGKENAILAGVPEPNPEWDKFSVMQSLPQLINDFSLPLVTKMWMLHKTRNNQLIYVGDEPVVTQNSKPSSDSFGNNGIACKGVEIYIPLTPHLALALLCPTLLPLIELSTVRSQNTASTFESQRFLSSINTGKPYLLTPPEVTRLNALQIAHSERFIMSQTNDFRQAKAILQTHPKMRDVPRYVR